MKKTIMLAILLASLATTQAQISVSVPVGYSTITAPTVGINIQAGIGNLRIATGFDNHLSKDKMKGNLVWARMGIGFFVSELNSLEITAGAGQFRRSTDQKRLNQGLAVVNVQYVHQMASRPEAALFASVTGTQKFAIIAGGLRFIFGRGGKQNYGCPSAWVR
jgi:hypothetical protein